MTKKEPPAGTGRHGGEKMVYRDGKWWYKGEAFDTLREALVSVWPKK